MVMEVTPLVREWTMIFPSAVRANRMPRGFSRVTRYSLRFILNEELLPDIAKTLRLRLPTLERTRWLLLLLLGLKRSERGVGQKDQMLALLNNGDDGG